MCMRIVDKSYSLDEALVLLGKQFTHVNVIQLRILFNDPHHFNLVDILSELPLLFYIIQTCSPDGKFYQVTIVTNFSVVFVEKKIRQIAKSCCNDKYKVSIFM